MSQLFNEMSHLSASSLVKKKKKFLHPQEVLAEAVVPSLL